MIWCLIRLKSLALPKLSFATLHLSCFPYLLSNKVPSFYVVLLLLTKAVYIKG